MSKLVKLMIVDDHDIFRDGLKSLITMKKLANVVGEASNGKEFIDVFTDLDTEMVLMDISMPEMDGVEATQKALAINPNLNVIVLSMFGDEAYYYKMIGAGAKGFLLKSSGKHELEQAIKVVSNGGTYFSSELLTNIIEAYGQRAAKDSIKEEFEELTKREKQILQLFCNGQSASDIAEKLCLSKKTIEGHRTKLFNKTGTKTSIGLVVYAIKKQLVQI